MLSLIKTIHQSYICDIMEISLCSMFVESQIPKKTVLVSEQIEISLHTQKY